MLPFGRVVHSLAPLIPRPEPAVPHLRNGASTILMRAKATAPSSLSSLEGWGREEGEEGCHLFLQTFIYTVSITKLKLAIKRALY